MSNNIKVLLIGAGNMGKAYAKVLQAQNIDFIVFTRSEKTSLEFKNNTGITAKFGDLDKLLKENSFTHAINAVNVEHLVDVTKTLVTNNVQNVLVEKPLGVTIDSIKELNEIARNKKAKIFVAYNRRYYASTLKALEIIKNDGGLRSIFFEFTEWKTRIDFSKYAKSVQDKWLIANSSHVIDLAFFFSGEPKNYKFYSAKNDISAKDIFVGSGITKNNVYFSYASNWDSPGRWGIELMTDKHRLYLRPMEKLFIQELNSVVLTEVSLDDKLDLDYKPGVYLETKDFLFGEPSKSLKTIEEQITSFKFYDEIHDGSIED